MTEESQASQLRIRYTDPDGKITELLLADQPITVGRSPDADIITLDERASRMHCSVRIWDGEYYVKDLKSKNGTYLNHQKIEMAKIKPGDKIRLGNSILHVDDKKSPGTDTTISSVQDEMNEGKGYKTILREIVRNTESPRAEKPSTDSENKTPKRVPKVISEGTKKPEAPLAKPAGSGSKVIRINKSNSSILRK
ncbi:FHA domain-containing protein [Kiritimatiellota bacterium B12222]|nr:FHA domain-containing protein [Kiritimatiellota bacterium B12222]